MQALLQSIETWLRGILISGILSNMGNAFDSVNVQVGHIAGEVAKTPFTFSPTVFSMIRTLSENIIMPIAGIILTFIACYELIQLVISHNNLANFETWIFFKWVFKTFIAVTLIANTMNITMAIFDVSQYVVQQAGGIITESTYVDTTGMENFEYFLEMQTTGELFSILLQSFVAQFLIYVLAALIYVVVYARMIEIYLMISMAPIPFATFGNKEQSMIGQNYVKSLFALGFQGFLIMVCVAIYAVLIQNIAFTANIVESLWKVIGITVLLCFTLFKTGSVAKSILHAH